MAETKIITGGGAPNTQVASETPAAIPAVQKEDNGISWTASEFISHDKSSGWYGTLALVAAIIAAFVYLTTKDMISTTVVIIAALAFAAVAGRKPRQLQYRLDINGITIGNKHLSYSTFKSFSMVSEGAYPSIVFRPLKRFAPLTTIYYAPADQGKIISLISEHLPLEEHKPDAVDNMMRRIRF
jgi:hypothetical protein